MVKKHSVRNLVRNSKNKPSVFREYKDWLTVRMNGGAYSVNVESQIAGQPVYDAYPDKYAPALINGKLEVTAPGSGCGAMTRGGARKNHKTSKKRSNQRKHRGGARKHTKAVRRNRSIRKSRSQMRNRKHHGGSMPAAYPDAYNGENSNFVDDMSKRDLGCSQPSWNPTCA